MLAVPLVVFDELIGVLALHRSEPHRWTAEEIRLTETVAREIALAIRVARLLRDNVVIHEGKIGSLRRFKDDVSEVKAGFECGIGFEKYNDIKVGDVIEAFVVERVAATA